MDTEDKIFIVADGMGGHAGGEIAAQMTTATIHNHIHAQMVAAKSYTQTEILQILIDAINLASTKVYEKALEEPGLKGMGTTATAVKIHADYCYCGHVGDSRVYLIREGFIYQLTKDHSLVKEQLEAGIITLEEAKTHKLRNVITRSVGYQETEYIDTVFFPIFPHDFILLCSDGLYNKVSNIEITHFCQRLGVDCVNDMIDLANERGGDDNITIILSQVFSP